MRLVILSLCFLVCLGSAHAEIRYGYVLECWADTCPLAGVYRFESVAPHPQSEEHFREMLHMHPGSPRSDFESLDIKVTLTRSLRGSLPITQSIVCPAFTKFPNTMPVKFNAADQFLVFFDRESASNEAQIATVFCLTQPLIGGVLDSALRPDFSVLTNGKMIEQIVSARIAAKPQLTHLTFHGLDDEPMARVEIPYSTAAHDAIYDLSICYLIIPKDLLLPGQITVPARPNGKVTTNVEEEEKLMIPLTTPESTKK